MFDASIFHCFYSQFWVSNAYFVVKKPDFFWLKIKRSIFSFQMFHKTNFQKFHLQTCQKIFSALQASACILNDWTEAVNCLEF
jgi:hypothetical protein